MSLPVVQQPKGGIAIMSKEIEIDFKIQYAEPEGDIDEEDYMDGTDGIRLVEPELNLLIDPDTIVLNESNVILQITYPLEQPADFKIESKNGFTRRALAQIIIDKYKQVYDEEEKGSTLPNETIAERNIRTCIASKSKRSSIINGINGIYLINRAKTNGPYGIWGHSIDDLIVGVATFDTETKILSLGVDS
jgi:hypothetical protein